MSSVGRSVEEGEATFILQSAVSLLLKLSGGWSPDNQEAILQIVTAELKKAETEAGLLSPSAEDIAAEALAEKLPIC